MKINLDINRSEPVLETINLRQGDGGLRMVDIQITENNQPIVVTGYTLQFEANLPSGSMVQHAGAIKDATAGLFSYTFTSSDTSEAGQLPVAYFRLYDSAKNSVATRNIRIVVDRAADITQSQANDYLAKVNQLITDSEAKLAANNQQIAAQQTQLTALQAGMTVGTRNLIRNGVNPKTVANWSYGNHNGKLFTDRHLYHKGRNENLFKLTNDGTADETSASSMPFSVKRTAQYIFQMVAFGDASVTGLSIFFVTKSKSDSAYTSTQLLLENKKLSTAKEETITIAFTTGANVDTGYIRIDNNGSSSGTSGALYFGDVIVAEGSIVGSAVPALEDQNAIDDAQDARIAALEAQIRLGGVETS
ncbi:BppU family phage baseplate upper protein [Lapidilactobacillus mulanensis]|uniref:BppU family phage baseplate upper protein n=1 Tax=Lapidilactobacillus mulanensis TaxID=2485999 RepID=A0ABW4DTE9_9LACO